MRSRSILLAAVIITVGTTVAAAQSHSRAVPPEAVQFVVNAATTDIHAHHPPAGKVQFRHARIGTLPQPNGTTFYLVCAEVAGVTEGTKPTWVPFVTIKMADYEQWLGEEATKDWCRHRKPIWDPRTDITVALQAKYDSL
jgi:Cu/Ag efflux protein CusF